MPDINLKAAPQREVLEITRIGSYGAFEYQHRLFCGHVEKRKRKATAKYIACTLCAVAIQAKKEFGELAPTKPIPQVPEDIDIFGSEVVSDEMSSARIIADLASVFKIPNEMISIVYVDNENGEISVGGATVWLDNETMQRLLRENRRILESEDEHRIRRPLGQQ
jgi:hypothetical protein